MNAIIPPLTVVTAVAIGLMAGLFFTFSNSVMAGLRRMPEAHGMAAMQAINVTIINPLFLTVFMGSGLACLVLGGEALFRLGNPGAMFVLAGAVLYVVGGVGVTMLANVPLNDALAAMDPQGEQSAAFWRKYLVEWTRLNHVRTLACTASLAALMIGYRWPAA
jgi:uncharacterized membrane protein